MHAAANEVFLQHAAAPGGAVNARGRGLGAEHGVAGDPGFVPALADDGVDPILGFDLKHCAGREVMQMDAAFDLGLNQLAVDVVAQVGVRRKERGQILVGVSVGVEGRQCLSSLLDSTPNTLIRANLRDKAPW